MLDSGKSEELTVEEALLIFNELQRITIDDKFEVELADEVMKAVNARQMSCK